jgi:hypothetical protein
MAINCAAPGAPDRPSGRPADLRSVAVLNDDDEAGLRLLPGTAAGGVEINPHLLGHPSCDSGLNTRAIGSRSTLIAAAQRTALAPAAMVD